MVGIIDPTAGEAPLELHKKEQTELRLVKNGTAGDADRTRLLKRYLVPSLLVVETVALLLLTTLSYRESRRRSTLHRNLSAAEKRAREREEESLALKESVLARQSELQAVRKEMERIQRERRTLEAEYRESHATFEETSRSLTREKQISNYLRKRITHSKRGELNLMEKIEALLKGKQSLEARIKKIERDKENLRLQIEGVPLKRIVVKPGAPRPGRGAARDKARAPIRKARRPPRLTGTILTTENRYGFVILDIGREDGLNVGDRLSVHHGTAKVGEVTVKKTYQSMSVADIDRPRTARKLEKKWSVVRE